MKIMSFKSLASMGALSVAGLGLVGAGAHAVYTSAVNVNNSVTSGSFQLEGQPSATLPSVSGPYAGDQRDAGAVPTVSSTPTLVAGPETLGAPYQGNTLTFNAGNMAPGDSYTFLVNVFDVGSLQGEVNGMTYTPLTGGGLLSNMTVSVQGGCVLSSGCGGSNWMNVGSSPFDAANAQTVNMNGNDYTAGPYFLQPNGNMVTSFPGTGEAMTTFQVTFTLNENAPNSTEGQTATAQLQFQGSTL